MIIARVWKFAIGHATLYEDGDVTATLSLTDAGFWKWEDTHLQWANLEDAINGIEEFYEIDSGVLAKGAGA